MRAGCTDMMNEELYREPTGGIPESPALAEKA
jgi:hypothetical protein